MKTIPIDICGQTYQDRSPQLSSQLTRNMYLGQGRAGESKFVLYDFPGCKPFATGVAADRGMTLFQGVVYSVQGTTLYSVSSSGTLTSIGTIGSGNRCVFRNNGSILVIVTGGIVYTYDGTTLAVETDADLESPRGVAYLNNQFLFDGDGGRFVAADAGTTDIDGLSYATAESHPDDLLIPYDFDQLVYMFGEQSIEPWFNSGVGSPPFDRLDQGIIQLGLGAIHSVANDDQFIYFLADNGAVYKLKGSSVQRISTPAIDNAVASYTKGDAVGFCFTYHGQDFYQINFPEISLLYSATFGYWVELSNGLNGERHLANSYVFAYDKHLVADYMTGNIYELDPLTYTDNGETRLRTRILPPLTGAQMGIHGRRVIAGRLQLDMEVGVGLASGQGSVPQIMCEWSNDGGKTWGNQSFVEIGEAGEYSKKVEFFQFASGYSLVARISCSDPVYLSIFSAFADVDDGGY